jgi:hypothetical protein
MAKPGNLFILSLLLISAVRLVSEFFRDVHAHTIGGEMVWIFNTTQLVLLPVILILFFIFMKKGKTTTAEKPATDIRDFSPVTTFFLLLLLFLCFSILKTGFVLPEIMVMHLAFSAAFGFWPSGWYTAGAVRNTGGFRPLVLCFRCSHGTDFPRRAAGFRFS